MKRLLTAVAAFLAASIFVTDAFSDTYVRGYTRRDGTYVQPHYRSSPNNSYNDNYSTRPNVNPYTGQTGTRSPTWNDRPPPSNSFGSPNSNPYSLPNSDPYGLRR
jgi:hypothetical protein